MIAKKGINLRQHVTVDTQKDYNLSVSIRQNNKRIVTFLIENVNVSYQSTHFDNKRQMMECRYLLTT